MSRRVRAWYRFDSAIRRIPAPRLRGLARGIASGVALGVAGDAWLDAVDDECYRRRYRYHDTDEHNLRGLFDWERDLIVAHVPAGGRVLVVAAGGGREVIALRRMGFEVDGVECHPALVERARGLLERLDLGDPIEQVPRNTCPTSEEPYDGVVVGWGAYTALRSESVRRGFLAQVHEALRPGGTALLSFFPRSTRPLRVRVVPALAQPLARITGGAGGGEGDVLDPNYQHYVDRGEFEGDARSARLKLVFWSTESYGHAILRRGDASS